jgi:nicotinamide mononucleotide (NMN) deamidase PncC
VGLAQFDKEAVKTEILTQHTHYGEYVFILIVAGAMALLFGGIVIALVGAAIKNGIGDGDIIGSIFCAVIAAVCVWAFVLTIAQRPDVTYKAKITDFNVVYENGYEIIEKDGELYTIRESEGD